jgi:hypothetical protein
MAYSIIQSTNQSNGASPQTTTFTNTPAQSNLILVSIIANGVAALGSVQDGNTNNLTSLNSNTDSLGTWAIYLYGMIATANQSKNIVVTATGLGLHVDIYEVSGNPTSVSNIIDNNQNNSGNSGSTTATSSQTYQQNVTSTNSNDLLFVQAGMKTAVTSPAWTTSGGATVNALQSNAAGSIKLFDGYAIETTNGTFAPYATWTTSSIVAQLTTLLLPGSASNTHLLTSMGVGN